MKPFKAPLDDILFCLNEVSGARRLRDWDPNFIQDLAEHFASFAENKIAPLDEPGDIQGCRLVEGRVFMPEGYREVYQEYAENGWPGLTAPEAYNGQELGSLTLAATSEIFSGACHSLQMVTGLVPGAIRTLLRFGSENQKSRYIPALVSGEYLATMCLTEPGAGSDLARVQSKAVQQGNSWCISGEKIFISGGDQNLSDKILHLVLARTGNDDIRGLSLFLCPSEKAGGLRNDVSVTRIEEKMGLHASPTCQMLFDGAEAELVGEPGQGLKAMFTMMNHARLDVALQGVAHAARAHDIARTYAAERIQGRNMDDAPARLEEHADIRRMLDKMDRLALGGRAMAHLASVTLEAGDNPDLVEFITPVAKVFCTEAGIRAAETGMQVLGGYGYLKEYRLEQTYRDARITSIYEGANGIHARMLVTRLLGSKSADAFDQFIGSESIETDHIHRYHDLWCSERKKLLELDDPTPFAHHFMKLTEETLLVCLWQRMKNAAFKHPDPTRIVRIAEQAIACNHIEARE